VLLKIAYLLMHWLFGLAVLAVRGDQVKDAELLVLRHENAVLRRPVGRVRYEPGDRAWFAALAHFIPRGRWAGVFPVTPTTLLAWHRKLAAKKYDTSRPVSSMTGTGEPTSWAAREPTTMSWLEHAAAYAAMKWLLAAAYTRAGIAEALATVTPAVSTPAGAGHQLPCCVPPCAGTRSTPPGPAATPARRDRSAGRGTEPLAAAARPDRPAGEPDRAGHPDLAPRWDPRGSCHHHPTAPSGACAGGFTDPRRYAFEQGIRTAQRLVGHICRQGRTFGSPVGF
jgi:hypothetical protein